jgi:hypothetical protein
MLRATPDLLRKAPDKLTREIRCWCEWNRGILYGSATAKMRTPISLRRSEWVACGSVPAVPWRLPAVRISPLRLAEQRSNLTPEHRKEEGRVPSRYEPARELRELLIKRTFLGNSAPNEREENILQYVIQCIPEVYGGFYDD